MSIPNGKGQSLETMSEVVKNFASESDKDLKVNNKVECDFPTVSLLPLAEFGPNDHREDAPLFTKFAFVIIGQPKMIIILGHF